MPVFPKGLVVVEGTTKTLSPFRSALSVGSFPVARVVLFSRREDGDAKEMVVGSGYSGPGSWPEPGRRSRLGRR